jgi:cytochrome b subunit of formate dehydrogenase
MTRPLAVSDRGEGPYLWRFTPLERAMHGMVIVSFFGLVITGLPLRFSHAPWARAVIDILGGVASAGFIHRICAVITFGYFFSHIGQVGIRFLRAKDRKAFFLGPTSMVPSLKDLHDVRDMFRWFLGLGPRPRFERFSYMEKFDYWAVFWGVAIIGGSGLFLWFPEFFARFLPGWVFNVATIVHGDEALLAAGFIFTIHFFNVHLRPEKFPIDLVVWTGRATADYMKEEHPLEYERAMKEGRVAQLTAPPPSRVAYVWGALLGFLSLALGIALILLILWAVLL